MNATNNTSTNTKHFPSGNPLVKAIALLMLVMMPILTQIQATNLYWDSDGASTTSTGGTGTWTTANTWRSGSATGTLGNWLDTNDAFFSGTAGIVTIGTTAVSAGTAFFTVLGYTLQTDAVTTARTYTGAINLSNNVNLKLMDSTATASRTLNIAGSVSGGAGSSLTIQGAQTSGNASRVNLAIANASISVPTTISGTGTGAAGYVGTAAGTSISGDITNNSGLTTILGATSGNSLTMNGKVTGSAGLMFAAGGSGGAGTVTLNVANDYLGATSFNAATTGKIKLGINNAISTVSDVTMGFSTSNGGIFDLNGFDQTIASLTSGAGGGSITNGGAAGGTNLNTLLINGTATPAAFGLVIGDGVNRKSALERGGLGSTTLNATQTYTGGTTVSGGTLTLGHATDTLANTGAVLVSGGTLALGTNTDTVGAVTMSSGSITGSGTSAQGVLTSSSYSLTGTGSISAKLAGSAVVLTKSNAGTASLSSVNTYSGATTISGGTLALGASGSINNSATISVANGATFDVSAVSGGYQLANGQTLKGTGTVIGAMTVLSGATLSPGNSPGTANYGNTTLNGGGNYNWQLLDTTQGAGTGWDFMNISGTLTLAATTGNKFNLNLWTLSSIGPDVNGNALNFNNSSNYTWTIASASGGISGFDATAFAINTSAINGTSGFSNSLGGGTFSLATSGSNLNLLFTPGSTALYWSGAGTGNPGTWSSTAPGAGTNGIWADTNTGWDSSKTANFAGTAGALTVTTATANKGITFSTNGYSLSGGTITLSSTGSNNVITTDTTVTATVSTLLSTSAGITKSGNGTLILNSTQTYTGGTLVSAGTLQLGDGTSNNGTVAGNITDNSAVAFANPNTQSYSGVISGSGSLSKSGAGTLTLTNANNYQGGTTITAGTLMLGNASDTLYDTGAVTVNGGTLNVGTNSDVVGAVTLSSGSIIGSGGTLDATSYTVNNAGGTATISANIQGIGALTKTGAGNLTLSGTNGYLSGTQLNGGNTTISSNDNLGNTAGVFAINSGTLTLAGNVDSGARALTIGTSGGTIINAGNNFSNSGTTAINGTLSTTGGGNVAIFGITTFGASGALNIGTGGSVTLSQTTGTITMANGGIFNGDLIVNTTARLNLNGSTNTYGGTGAIKILGSALGTSSGGAAISGGAFTNFNALISNASGATAGIISSDIVLNPTGTGHVAFTAGDITTATYTTASYLAFIGGTNGATGNGIVVNGKITGESDLFIGNNSKTGGGAGNLTLNAVNDYAGNTLINAAAATIKLGVDNALPTTTNVIAGSLSGFSTPTLDLNGHNQQTASLSDGDQVSVSKFLTIKNNGANDAVLTINGSVTPFGTFAGKIQDGTTNKITLIKDGSNNLTLAGANTYTGGTTINGGTLKLGGGGNILADSGAITLGGGTFDINAANETVGAVTLNSGSIINSGVDQTKALTGSSYDVRSGTVSAVLAGSSVALTKNTAGTVTLSAANTYTGDTTVNAGTLLMQNTTESGTGSGVVSVTAGATHGILGGTGIINATSITVNGDGTTTNNAVLMVGNTDGSGGIAGNLTFTGTLNVTLGGMVQFDLFNRTAPINTYGAGNNDLLTFSGTGIVRFGSTAIVNINNSGLDSATLNAGDRWNLIDWTTYAGNKSTQDAIFALPTLSGYTINTSDFYNGGTVFLETSSAPEPSRAVLMLLGAAGLLMRRRRKTA